MQSKSQGSKLQPLEISGVQAVKIGTLIWMIALGLLILNFEHLKSSGRVNWIWVSLSGVTLGLLGLRYTSNRAKRINKQPIIDQSELIQDFE